VAQRVGRGIALLFHDRGITEVGIISVINKNNNNKSIANHDIP